MKISNKAYDVLSIIAKIVAPIATFISALLTIWNIPYAQQITASLAAFDTCLGVIVTILKNNYDKEQACKQG